MEKSPDKGKSRGKKSIIASKEKGKDSYGNKYTSLEDMWKQELEPKASEKVREEKKLVGSKEDWYKKSNDYWNVNEEVAILIEHQQRCHRNASRLGGGFRA